MLDWSINLLLIEVFDKYVPDSICGFHPILIEISILPKSVVNIIVEFFKDIWGKPDGD